MTRTSDSPRATAEQILDVAERLVQTRGFNGFSYATIAAEVKITTASMHYHFPGKAELGQALIKRYAARFSDALLDLDDTVAEPAARLSAYADLYGGVLRGDRMCLCGMLAAEYTTLPEPMQESIATFFDDNEVWVVRVLDQGSADGTLRFRGSSRDTARMIVGGLEGAMLVSHPFGDHDRFQTAADQLIANITA